MFLRCFVIKIFNDKRGIASISWINNTLYFPIFITKYIYCSRNNETKENDVLLLFYLKLICKCALLFNRSSYIYKVFANKYFVKSRIKCNRRQSFISTRNSRYSNEEREREKKKQKRWKNIQHVGNRTRSKFQFSYNNFLLFSDHW